MALDPAIVDALYRALLGRSADDAGLASWAANAHSADDVIAGLTTSPEGMSRLRQLALALTTNPDAERGFSRLQSSCGSAALGDIAPSEIAAEVLATLPLTEISGGIPDAHVHTIGPYAEELGHELERRGLAGSTVANPALTRDRGAREPDVLVLTDPAGIGVLQWGAPQVLDRTRLRIVSPVVTPMDAPDWLASQALALRRDLLHRLGYLEVRLLVQRRHGDVTDMLQVAHKTHVPGDPLIVHEQHVDPIRRTPAVWSIGDRIPTYDHSD